MENLSAAKFMLVSYMCIVFIFILGFLLLHETVYFTDAFGAGMIIAFQIYNYYYPPGIQVNQEDNNEADRCNTVFQQPLHSVLKKGRRRAHLHHICFFILCCRYKGIHIYMHREFVRHVSLRFIPN